MGFDTYRKIITVAVLVRSPYAFSGGPGTTDDVQSSSFRLKRRIATMKALAWHGKGDIRCETVPDPKIRAWPRRHHQGHSLRDLRLGFAYLRRCHSLDGKGRRPRSRDHGRGCRGRRGEQEAEGRRPRRGPLHDLLRRMLLLQARLLSPAASAPIRTSRWRKSCGDIRPRGCSATRICLAVSRAVRPNICACPSPMSARSRCRKA